jgi:hypothetical protein
MKRLFAVMTVIVSIMVSGEIYARNFIASTEHDLRGMNLQAKGDDVYERKSRQRT